MKKTILFLVVSFFVNTFIYAQTTIPRPEYPRPQFERSEWINLNGNWTYVFDQGKSGKEQHLENSKGFDKTIIVPFCPESKLSGVAHTDFIDAMWYHRKITIPENWSNKKIILHFGAVDYESEIFIDGKSVCTHYGGTSSFTVDITDFVSTGKQQNLVVYVKDDLRSGRQPGGKQSPQFNSFGCMYTRTTGIWQTVWLEPVDNSGLASCQIIPDLDNQRCIFNPAFFTLSQGIKFRVTIKDGNKIININEVAAGNNLACIVPVANPKTWSPENPFLYDLQFEVIDKQGKTVDIVKSYFGMRKINIEGNKIYLNNKPIFLRFVLDQGFYPTGIWTAPSDDALKNDIILSMDAGFNGARLHQKVFEERFHYWADKLGYLTWAESSSWGMDNNEPVSARNFLSEWEEIVMRDRNYPSIIAWTPFNETWDRANADGRQHNRFISDIYKLTHALDNTRPVNDASGNYHVITDIFTVHNYDQDPTVMRKALTPDKEKGVHRCNPKYDAEYKGQPYIVDEYGGIKWIPGQAFANNSWGYGEGPKTLEEYYTRLEALTDVLLSIDIVWGYCYTQLTDVEQEQNGIYNYDRTKKFDMNKIKKIFSKTK